MVVLLMQSLALSLTLTILMEELFAVILGIRDKKDLILIGLVNVITNPVVVLSYYLFLYYTDLNLMIVTIVLEIMAIYVESLYYKRYGKDYRHPIVFSLSANAFSFGVGKILNLIWN